MTATARTPGTRGGGSRSPRGAPARPGRRRRASPAHGPAELIRLLARHGIHGEPEETNAATAQEAAGGLLLAIGVTPDIHPADRTEGARRIRELMAAAGRQGLYLHIRTRWVGLKRPPTGRARHHGYQKPGLPAME